MADIATLGLRVDASGVTEGTRALDTFQAAGQRAEISANRFGRAVAEAGKIIAAGWITRKIIQETIESQNAMAQLEARIRSTGGVAGKTAQDLDKMSSQLERMTTYSDEAVKGVQALLLTFKNIRGDTFDQATMAVLDMATAMGTDARSAALQLGKALEDPARQMSVLRRTGVSFTAEQELLAKQLQDTGDLAGAQAIILRELQTEFGGAAEAARATLGGALLHLQNQWGNLFEVSRDSSSGIIDAINGIADALPAVRDNISAFLGGIALLGADAAVALGKIELAIARINDNVAGGAVFRLTGLGPGRGTMDALGIVDITGGNRSVDEAEKRLLDLRHSAAEVRREFFDLGKATTALASGFESDADGAAELDAVIARLNEKLRVANIYNGELTASHNGVAGAMRGTGTAADEAAARLGRLRELMGGGHENYVADVNAQVQEIADNYNRMGNSAENAAEALRMIQLVLENSGVTHDELIRKLREEIALMRQQAGLGGMGAGAGGWDRAPAAGSFFGSMGGSGTIISAAITGGTTAAASAIAGALGGMVKSMAESAQRAREAARLMRVALAEFGRSMQDAAAGLSGGSLEELRQQIQGVIDQWFELTYPGTQKGSFAAGAQSIEELQRQLAELNAAILHGGKNTEAWLRAMGYINALIAREQQRQAEEAYRRSQEIAAEEQRVREENARLEKERAAEIKRILEEAAEAAKRAAEFTRNFFDSLVGRAYGALGNSAAAGRAALLVRHNQDRLDMVGQSPQMQALVGLVQTMELAAYDLDVKIAGIQDNLELQLAALEDQKTALAEAWQKQDEAYAEQIKTAQEQLRTANDQLRAQERTVEELRRVSDGLAEFQQSLLTSNLTTLSPFAQLEAARAQFQSLASRALAGDVTAAGGLSGAARTFLEASRGYNASGTGYARDFDLVQATIAQVQGRIGTQLTVEERTLNELQAQTAKLQAQIEQLEASREQARQEYEAQIRAIEEQARAAREAAQSQIDVLRAEFDAARVLWEQQLEALLEQIRLLQFLGTQLTDQGGGGIIDIQPNLALITEAVNTQGRATVNVLSAGLQTLSADVDGLRAEVSSLRGDVRRGMEAAL